MATTHTPPPNDPLNNTGLCRCGHGPHWHTTSSRHTKCGKGDCPCTGYLEASAGAAPGDLSAAAVKVFEVLRVEGPRALRGDRKRLAERLGLDVLELGAAVRELHRVGHLFFDATYLLTFAAVPGVAPSHHTAAVVQMLEDAREEVDVVLATLPTQAPTAEEMAAFPTAVGEYLRAAREALEVAQLRLSSLLAIARPGVDRKDALEPAECGHEATPSAPFTCLHCGNALPRDFYERKANAPQDCAHDVQPIPGNEDWGRCTKCNEDEFPITSRAAYGETSCQTCHDTGLVPVLIHAEGFADAACPSCATPDDACPACGWQGPVHASALNCCPEGPRRCATCRKPLEAKRAGPLCSSCENTAGAEEVRHG